MKQKIERSHYDNSHHTSEYSPFHCTNCGQCFGFFLGITQNKNNETLCFFCFENLPEPKTKEADGQ